MLIITRQRELPQYPPPSPQELESSDPNDDNESPQKEKAFKFMTQPDQGRTVEERKLPAKEKFHKTYMTQGQEKLLSKENTWG